MLRVQPPGSQLLAPDMVFQHPVRATAAFGSSFAVLQPERAEGQPQMSQLPTILRDSVGQATTRVSSGRHTPHVLVADANPTSRQEREEHLRAAGARVLTARTGFEAIVKASCQMPDLIVLDESLGEVEVAETARMLTICPVTAQTPVLCLRSRRRVPLRILAGLRRKTLT
jgi:CheY-like chemotaxis protein